MDFRSKLESAKEALQKANFEDFRKRYGWFLKRLPDILHLKNIVVFVGIASLVILILFTQRFASLYSYLPQRPLSGGIYEEGVVGKIEQFNPLFSPTNSAEQAVTKLIFSGLTKRNGSYNNVPDIAEKWDISADGKTYTFYLRKDVKWHDGSKLTADDVIFTVDTMQNPDVRSPLLEVWKGVNAEKINDYTVAFKLQSPYSPFITTTDFAIIPKHILETVPPRNIKISEFSLKPIGTGLFKFKETKQIRDSEEVTLIASENYYGKKPYLSEVLIKTYQNADGLADGYVKREVKGVEKIPSSDDEKYEKLPNLNIFETAMPIYDVVYFNLRNGVSKNAALRQAVAAAIDRNKIIQNVYQGRAEPVYTPILPGLLGSNSKLKQNLDLVLAKQKLTDAGFIMGSDGILAKDGVRASVRLVTSDDKMKSEEADLIAANLGLLGIETKVEKYPMGALIQDYVRPRNFDLLLISQNAGDDPDLYSFWHGTQVNDPGLNFSGFNDRRVDKYLEQTRAISDPKQRADKFRQILQIIWDETPAVYVSRPNYRYGISSEVKGVEVGRLSDPSDRFWDIANWYISEERADKK